MAPALVAQGIERSPPERKAASSNLAEGATLGEAYPRGQISTGSSTSLSSVCLSDPFDDFRKVLRP